MDNLVWPDSHPAAQLPKDLQHGEDKTNLGRENWLQIDLARRIQKTARPRQVILRAGELLEGVPILAEGWAACVSRLSDGRRQILSFLLPGDLVSASAVFSERLSFYVEAITPVRYFLLDRRELTDRIAADAGLFNVLIKSFVAEREQADQLAIDLGRRSARERIARLLWQFRQRLKIQNEMMDDTFDVPVRQQHIADATGLTAVHVNRVLGAFKAEGVVDVVEGRLRITDLKSLCRIADVKWN